MATSTQPHRTAAGSEPRTRHPLYSALIGLATLGVLLQGLWAGLFVHAGKGYQASWVHVHALGAEATIALAGLATLTALVSLRARKDLVVGSIAFVVLLVLESYIGGLIGAQGDLTAVHFPLAMGLMALAVWLPLRATRRG